MITGTQTATRTIDVYRTRLAARSQIEPRVHPVVWGADPSGPLTTEQVRAYDEHGYHTAEGVLGDTDIATCLSEVESVTSHLGDDERVVRAVAEAPVPIIVARGMVFSGSLTSVTIVSHVSPLGAAMRW